MPASFQRRISALLVPLSSPRATKRDLAFATFRSASTMSLPPSTRAGSLVGPTRDEVVMHHLSAVDAKASLDKSKLCRLVVHEDHIAVATLADFEGLPRSDRDHPDLNAGLFGEGG